MKGKFLKSQFFAAIMAALLTIVFTTQISNVFDRKLDMNGDNICYYTLAQSLHQGLGYSYIIGLDGPTPHMHFPPGYPAFISALMFFGVDSVVGVKVANCILLLASILLLFHLIRRISSSTLLAGAVCLAVSCHAEILRWASMMMSEQLYLLTTTIVILLLSALEQKNLFVKGEWKSKIILLAAAVLLGYVYLVRSMGLSLAVAAVLWALCLALNNVVKGLKTKNIDWMQTGRHLAVAAVLLAGTLSFKAAWDARNESLIPGFKTDYLGDFNKKPGGETMSTVSDWTERIVSNSQSYLSCYVPDALFELNDGKPVENPGPLLLCAGLLLVIFISYGLLRLGKTGFLIFLYLAVTYAVLMIWPEQYAGLRYFVTLIPLLILGFFSGLYGVVGEVLRLRGKKTSEVLSILPVVLALFFMVPRYVQAQESYHASARYKSWKQFPNPSVSQFCTACEWAGKNLPASSRMMCRKPELYYMFSGFRHSCQFPQYASVEQIMDLIDGSSVEYIIIDWMYIHAYRTLVPAVVRNPERFAVIKQWGRNDNSTGEMATLILKVIR